MKYLKIKNLEDYSTRTLDKARYAVFVVTWRYNADEYRESVDFAGFAQKFENSAKLFREIK